MLEGSAPQTTACLRGGRTPQGTRIAVFFEPALEEHRKVRRTRLFFLMIFPGRMNSYRFEEKQAYDQKNQKNDVWRGL